MTERPSLALLSTGGTIAGTATPHSEPGGYTAGVLPGESLLEAVPGIRDLAHWQLHPCLSLDSKDMRPAHWLQIARAARELLARPDIDALVICHGTDTLEETALFLDLVLETRKAVVITGAMRPASAVSADGPANLLDAARAASHPDSRERGVLVCFGECIYPARTVRKQHAFRLQAFAATDGPVGRTRPTLHFFRPPGQAPTALPMPDAADELPEVEILLPGAGSATRLAEQAVTGGARGLVLALAGNGSLPDYWEETVRRLSGAGTAIVRASRCAESDVVPRQLDGRLGTWPAGTLSPTGARVALMLALATANRQGAPAEMLFQRIVGGDHASSNRAPDAYS